MQALRGLLKIISVIQWGLDMSKNKTACECVICKQNHAFELSRDLLSKILSGRVALFAGAGISTESRNVFKHTFYETVANELQVDATGVSFPEMMDKMCQEPDGRYKMIGLLKERFDTIESFPELYRGATRFHHKQGALRTIDTIITTNWDTYFEDVCKATPFVTDADLAFWDDADRRVLKIHGSIRSYGSLVATSDDYKKCQKKLKSGIIGSVLKSMLATKTVLFIGYSMNDSDFQYIFNFVKQQMEGLHKQAYIVTPYSDDAEKFKEMGLIPIVTSGEFFIDQIKEHATSTGALLPDLIYHAAHQLLDTVIYEHQTMHDAIKCTEHPQVIFASCYQDGMIHALERMLQQQGSGEYSDPCRAKRLISAYTAIQKEKHKKKNYYDVAYIEGYINAILYVLFTVDEAEEDCEVFPPLYFAFGHKEDVFELDEFCRILPELPAKHRTSYKKALSMVSRLAEGADIVFHHPPWL